MKTLSFVASAAAAAIFTGPAMAQSTPQALEEAFVTAVINEDAGALAKLYTDDATSFSPDGSLAVGQEQIEASWAPFFEAFDGITIKLSPLGKKKVGDDTVINWGRYTMSMTPAGEAEGAEAVSSEGRYSDVMVKTKDGWRYMLDHADEGSSGD
ncbi:MAG: nuclear transport factor 2 family protein [Parvularculaceae bacterium]